MLNLHPDFYSFVNKHGGEDVNSLALKYRDSKLNFDLPFALIQIEARKKYIHKLKDFLILQEFIFPDSISGEQASHQAVATFHANLCSDSYKILDMTAGLGIDAISFASVGKSVTALELDKNKAEILLHNKDVKGCLDLNVINQDSITFLKNTDDKFDLIFIDPARRDENKNRVFKLQDCSPDIVGNIDLILKKTEKLLIKASPLLDVTETLRILPQLTAVRAIGVKGECKELLLEVSDKKIPNGAHDIILEAIDLDINGTVLSRFTVSTTYAENKGNQSGIKFAGPEDIKTGHFLLEPSAMMMKLACWDKICNQFNALKLDKSSHLFISDVNHDSFPGRVTKIDKVIKKQDRKSYMGFPASVVSRNYPMSSDELRKLFKLKEGDNHFFYATRVGDKPVIISTDAIRD